MYYEQTIINYGSQNILRLYYLFLRNKWKESGGGRQDTVRNSHGDCASLHIQNLVNIFCKYTNTTKNLIIDTEMCLVVPRTTDCYYKESP